MAQPAQRTLRRRAYDTLQGGHRRSAIPRVFAAALIILILVNVIAAVFETVPELVAAHGWVFHGIEAVSLAVFGAEYVVRVWASVEEPRAAGRSPLAARLRYAMTPAAIVDLLAVAPFFVRLLFPYVDIRVIVLLRLLRLFKLGRYSTGFQSLYEALRRERQALLASGLILVSVILVAASLGYLAEREAQPEAFGNIPKAIWWAVETVTTVGYGDVVPHTSAGRIIGGLTMVTGILMIAIPIAIIGSSFAEIARQRSFVATFVLVARLPLFATLDSRVLKDLVPLMRAETYDAGATMVGPGTIGDEVCVIADGIVEIDYPQGHRRLSTGEVFGASPDPAEIPVSHPATALTLVKLLTIDRTDLARLIERYPELAARFRPDAGASDPKAPPAV
ncbi:MAG TPA: cyclic nucleotide-gated ion channel [Bauldia sp.]|nr:cyclic nucleotide-gated ion channel [Bauldia sp.]